MDLGLGGLITRFGVVVCQIRYKRGEIGKMSATDTVCEEVVNENYK